MFNDPRNGSLAEAQIKKWIVMDESKIRNDPTVTVLARLTNGQVILAEKKFGKGVVILWGTSIDTDWTNLPASKLPPVHSTNRILSFRKSPTPQNSGCRTSYYPLLKRG